MRRSQLAICLFLILISGIIIGLCIGTMLPGEPPKPVLPLGGQFLKAFESSPLNTGGALTPDDRKKIQSLATTISFDLDQSERRHLSEVLSIMEKGFREMGESIPVGQKSLLDSLSERLRNIRSEKGTETPNPAFPKPNFH